MDDATPSEDGSASERAPVVPSIWSLVLLLVCLGSFLAQSMIVPRDSPPAWDEAIYLSQVSPDSEAVFFASWRARGITFMVAPAVVARASIENVRLYLMVLSTVGLGLSFGVWVPLIRLAASVAAFLFAFTWVALHGASQVMPNLWSALFCLVAAGFTIRRSESGRTLDGSLAAAALTAAALIRPTDATVLFVVLAAFVVLNDRRSWKVVLSLASGLLVGWLPWIVEMSLRFGGPLQAAHEVATGFDEAAPLASRVLLYLLHTDGQLSGSAVPVAGIIWWGGLGILSVLGLLLGGICRGERAAALVASLAALGMLIQYFVFVPNTAARFLLPAYAFLAISASIGLVSLLRRGRVLRYGGVIVILLVLPWTVWQASVARRVALERREGNGGFREVGQEIARLSDGAPCAFLSRRGFPQIQLASGCVGGRVPRGVDGPTEAQLEQLRSRGDHVFVILRKPVRRDSPLRRIRPERFHEATHGLWLIYRFP